jgi:hypothetical protein
LTKIDHFFFDNNHNIQKYLIKKTRTEFEDDLLFLFRIYVILNEFSKCGEVMNGRFCEYFALSNSEMLKILKGLQFRLGVDISPPFSESSQDEYMWGCMQDLKYYFYNSFKKLINEIELLYSGQHLFQHSEIYFLDFISSICPIGDLFVKVLLCHLDLELQEINFADLIVLRQKEICQELNLFIQTYFNYMVIDHDHWDW